MIMLSIEDIEDVYDNNSDSVWEIAVPLAVAGDVFDSLVLCCHFPTRCLE